jgi:PBP1b-binding outer membrane lipoprotein LpoB
MKKILITLIITILILSGCTQENNTFQSKKEQCISICGVKATKVVGGEINISRDSTQSSLRCYSTCMSK